MINERWSVIKDFDGLYEISDNGRIKALARIVGSKNRKSGNNVRTITEKCRCPEITNGYNRVTLSNKGIKKRFLVHRLVAFAFINNPLRKPCVNHIDGNKLNNHYSNLEWCTYSENELHSHRVLFKKVHHSEESKKKTSLRLKGKTLSAAHIEKLRKPKSKKENYPRKKVILNGSDVFASISEASYATGCSKSSISNNLIGLSAKTKIGIWQYFPTKTA